MIEICPLSSGSKGNSIFIKTAKSKVLIDAGISFLSLEKKLLEIDEDIKNIDAIFITHEHFDHIAGLKVITDRLNIPIITNSDTAKQISNILKINPKFKVFTTQEEFEFQDLCVYPFALKHDSVDPVGFLIKNENKRLGFCTDLGFVTSSVINALKNLDFLYIEANHQISFVESCNRPLKYKERVLSKYGHLSNDDMLYLLKNVMHENLKYLFLAHISEECNSLDLLKNLIEDFLMKEKSKTQYFLAYQKKISKKVSF